MRDTAQDAVIPNSLSKLKRLLTIELIFIFPQGKLVALTDVLFCRPFAA